MASESQPPTLCGLNAVSQAWPSAANFILMDFHDAATALARTHAVGLATLFVDRDGTLVAEPPDKQIDALDKIQFLPGVFAALNALQRAGYRLVMVTNQDGLGTDSFPLINFERCQNFIVQVFVSQGIDFVAVFICPHRTEDHCERCGEMGSRCRVPRATCEASRSGHHR